MISTAELAKKEFTGLKLPAPYREFLGEIPADASMSLWGPPGSGKSTLAMDVALVLADLHGKGIYCSSEEGPGPSLQNKIKRLKAEHENIFVDDFDGFEKLKNKIDVSKARFVIVDSVSKSRIRVADFESFLDWCKAHQVISIFILHTTKEGTYKGPTEYIHNPDIEIQVDTGVGRIHNKNRFQETPREMKIVFDKTGSKHENDTRKNGSIPAVKSNAFGPYTTLKDLKKRVLKWAKKNLAGKTIQNIDQDIPIQINWQGLKKSAGSYFSKNKLLSIKKLPSLLTSGILISKEPDKEKRAEIKAIYKFTAPIQIDNCKYETFLVVRETLQGRFYYDHNLSEIKKPGGISGNSPQKENMHQPSPGTKKGKETRNKKQRPNPAADLVYLGFSDKIKIDGNKFKGLEGKYLMVGNLDMTKLFLVPLKHVKTVKNKVSDSRAVKLFELWHQYSADNTDFEIDWPDTREVKNVGTANLIYYISDKIIRPGDQKENGHYYKHHFDKGKRPVGVMGNVLVIENINWNERGILN